jgi:hypothetical protein
MQLAAYKGIHWKVEPLPIMDRVLLVSLLDSSSGVVALKKKVRFLAGQELKRQTEAIQYFGDLQNRRLQV